MAGASRAWLAVVAIAGFAAGWFAREALIEPPPPPAPPPPFDAGTPVDAGVLAPAVDPIALAATDRAAAIAWWATAPDSPLRASLEHTLALPAGVGFFDYLAPVLERGELGEADAGMPAPLGYFVEREGSTCRYLASRVPLAQGGIRVKRDCAELTTLPPRWLVVRVAGRDLLFDIASRRFATEAETPNPPGFLYATDASGKYLPRTIGSCRWLEGGPGVTISPEIEAFATSEVRPIDTAVEAGVVSSPWVESRMRVRTSGERSVFMPSESPDPDHAAEVAGDVAWLRPLAMPGPGGYYVVFGEGPNEADAGGSARVTAVTCDASSCATIELDLP